MRSLSFICCLILSALIFSLSAADTYTVNTKSKLNLRSGPGTSYSVVTQVAPGTIVTMVEEGNGKWIKVESNGSQGYVMKKYLKLAKKDSAAGEKKRYKISEDPQNRWLLWTIVALFIVVILNFSLEICENRFIVGSLYLALPAAIILYTLITEDSMWFCDPDIVGWVLTIINVILLIVAIMVCGTMFFEIMGSVFNDFNFMLLLVGLLFGAAIILMIIAAIKQLLIVALIMILGAFGGGTTKVGTFIDTDGNIIDIFKRN